MEREAVPFAYGAEGIDCIRFGAGAVEALTGADPLGALTWSDERSARRLVARFGGIDAAVSGRLREIAPARAHRGDIAAAEDPEQGLLIMVIEGEMLVAPGEHGLRRARRTRMVRAWSAG